MYILYAYLVVGFLIFLHELGEGWAFSLFLAIGYPFILILSAIGWVCVVISNVVKLCLKLCNKVRGMLCTTKTLTNTK